MLARKVSFMVGLKKEHDMPLISIALALAEFAPSLMRLFGAGQDNVNTAEKVIDIAKTVTGASSPEQALEMLKVNSERQQEFNMAVLKSNAELDIAYLADMNSARTRDAEFVKAGTHNYRADTMYALAIVVIVGLVYAVFKSGLDEYAKGIITLVLGRFLGYLDNIYNFEFGTTRASKTKDETIRSLSK